MFSILFRIAYACYQSYTNWIPATGVQHVVELISGDMGCNENFQMNSFAESRTFVDAVFGNVNNDDLVN